MMSNDLTWLDTASKLPPYGLPRNGLVAIFDPYRDTYGRNILPVGSEDFVTGWAAKGEATITVTPGQPDPDGGNNACRICCEGNGTREDCTVYEVQGINSAPHSTLVFSIWAKTLSGSAIAENTQSEAKPIPSDWSRISLGIHNADWSFSGFATTTVGGTFDILVYQPQVNISTLYPYSPPAGLPQSLTDYTGHANNAQLGSVAWADTNDPKFNGVALAGDGVDDYAVVPLASAAYRISVVDSGSGYTVVDEVPAYLNLFKTGASTYLNGKIGPTAYYNRVPTAAEIAQAKRYFKRLMSGREVTVS